ncbi:IS110 family transposase [Lacinutrix sp. Bg11-31]|uniref:IS110 family transposase n=1 Tax=Lacinutrix sp. Bg11-31 TaxID=2057808 RepID=UPI000C30BFAD|nr:IS110 family transposase [Lacinutrix sp. Bg11-31]AUC80727.1 IS110 family transposase [Lacinutrix sp. Bg11-31]AUC80745.1 IS110 family transposase [Lacinutrix sp. Bg11-31]AUC82710.1 IS110 family transposase [Lacinutrix sp. Bg11-31]AUC82714.1 IS110 family transposase [Lacinutrix sp. Bg11-31]AUC83523.1 IS110 family transposase [Lacinutrix sp. Bg11-31]
MKNYKEVVGIDVSKKTIDAFCYQAEVHKEFINDVVGYKSLLKWVSKYTNEIDVFYCFENTGYYSLKLALYFASQSIVYVEESPLKIKRSSGIVKEKTDKLDAALIARYAWLYREELEPSTVKSMSHLELGRLLALRDQLVRNNAGLKGTLKEMKILLSSPTTDSGCISLKRSIDYLSKQVKSVEDRIKEIISQDESMQKNYELLSSLKGVGLVVASQLIYHTGNFTRFASWRAFSSYCGTAPFEHRSGTSIYKRKQCHYLGDRKMKSLLSMASVSAIQHDSELRQYYKRKVAEGKDKMLAINNVRNKLIARAFAVVKRGTPYVVLQQHAA